jgi:hypothetical protein
MIRSRCTQRELEFKALVGDIAKEHAIDAVERGANVDWLNAAMAAIDWQRTHRETFTTDNVWEMISHLDPPREPRAMGAAMREAARRGWIVATDRVVKSTRPKCHRRPVRVWRGVETKAF